MNNRGPVRVADLDRFDTLVDARSPAEFALDHIPGAINCPSLDDEERRIVGTLYKEKGAFEARRTGGAMVAANLARHLRERFADRPADWKPLVYCWRGGLRSGSMVQWLRLVGWDAQQLAGGYKSWRRHVIDTIESRVPALELRILCGATGSAKTRILQAMGRAGAQVIDLEALACHKGSLLGAVPGLEQPAQKAFETGLATALAAIDPQRPVTVEGESSRIGRISLPAVLVDRMRASECVEIVASAEARLAYLLHDYAYLGDDRQALADRIAQLDPQHGLARKQAWQAQALEGRLAELFADLAERHYDPLYARSQRAHFARWEGRRIVPAGSLDPATIDAIAQGLADELRAGRPGP